MPRLAVNNLDGEQHGRRQGGATSKNQQIATLQASNRVLKSKMGSLRALYNTVTHSNVQLQQELDLTRTELETAKAELGELRRRAAQSIHLPSHLTSRRLSHAEVYCGLV